MNSQVAEQWVQARKSLPKAGRIGDWLIELIHVSSSLAALLGWRALVAGRRNRELFLAPIMLLGTVLASSAALPKNDAKEREARALLARARELTDLRAPGSLPFRLRAEVKLAGTKGPDISGKYLLAWVWPDRFREEISVTGFAEMRIALGDKLWRQRNLSYVPLRVWQLRRIFEDYPQGRLPARLTVKKIHKRDLRGFPLTCIEFAEPSPAEFCLDPATGLPHRISYPKLGLSYEFEEFVPLGKTFFPRARRLYEDKNLVVEAHTEEIEAFPDLPPGLLTPPAGGEVLAWCPNPEPPQPLPMGEGTLSRLGSFDIHRPPPVGRVALYAKIGPDGRPRDVTVIEPLEKSFDAAWQKQLEGARFRPATCNGVPIEADDVLEENLIKFPGHLVTVP